MGQKERTDARSTDLGLCRRLVSQQRPYWHQILGILLLDLLGSALALLTPVPLQIAVDSVIGSKTLPGFLAVAVPSAVARSTAGVLLLAVGLMVAVSLLARLQWLT